MPAPSGAAGGGSWPPRQNAKPEPAPCLGPNETMKTPRDRFVWTAPFGLCLFTLMALAQATAPRLEIQGPGTGGEWMRLRSTFHSNTVLGLQASTNLGSWQTIGTFHNALFDYPDAASGEWPRRFYRLAARPRGLTDDWKNQILFPVEPFRSSNAVQSVTWVKFALVLAEPARIYYQDSRKYLFHYDFATHRLPPFLGMDPASFDAVSLRRTNQQVVLGAVLYPPLATTAEYGVQFVGLDPYTPEEIERWYKLVRATVYASNAAQALYMPSFEQAEVARTRAEEFAARGIPVGTLDRWVTLNPCYSTGWAVGRLKYFAAGEVTAAFADGRLAPGDILLTDGVPADTPIVAGIVTLTPSTPNSHTAILSQSFGLPFVYLADPADQARAVGLAGRKVLLRATASQGVAQIKLLDVDGLLEPALEAEMLALKVPAPLNFQPRETYGALWASTELLTPADIRYFGGKAANYGLLRRAIPTNCPAAIAFSFDLWETFLEQQLPGGRTLREEIAARLAPYTNYPPDIVSLKTNLAAIRNLFTRTATFSPAQRQAILGALVPHFDPLRKIRFRSSTNVEDAEQFTGAGLYDSYSGCLQDDLDGDTAGPCWCDPAESNERGVFRALQKVYASFYNDDAFLERLLHQVDETRVAMGVLVHHSFPDEEELANGVALLAFSHTAYSTNLSGDLVTQWGAVPVANPEGSALPEIVSAFRYNTSTSLTLRQYSSLLPLGDYVMDWPADYRAFMDLFAAVGAAFRQFYPGKTSFRLDFEYKKDLRLGRVVKQVRELPQATATNSVIPFLVDEPLVCTVRQAEGDNVFASHRLKSVWNLHTANLRLAPTNLAGGIYTTGTCEFVENGAVQALSGSLSAWPNASNAPAGTVNYWTTGAGDGRRTWQLATALVTNVPAAQPPVLTQGDFSREVTVAYATPMPVLDWMGEPATVTNETVRLEPRPTLSPEAILQERLLVRTNVATVQTRFYWPKEPQGVIIYTAPLLQFAETRITGLTTSPIVLTNAYSQTYGPGHHNFSEEFIFEPRLEPGLSPATLAELQAANIQLIYVHWRLGGSTTWRIVGLDNKIRPL